MSASGLRYELTNKDSIKLVLIDAPEGVVLQLQQNTQQEKRILGGTVLSRSDARHVAATLRLMGESE